MKLVRRIGGWLSGVFVVAGLAQADALAQSCAMCRSAIQSAGDPLARGINLSVAFMVTMPFAVVGSIGGWLAYVYRRARRQAQRGSHPADERRSCPQGVQTLPEVLH